MRSAEAVRLFDYVYWVRDTIFAAASQLSDDEFLSTASVATRDLRATLVHELDVESTWRERLSQVPASSSLGDGELRAADYPTLDALDAHWRREEAAMRSWLATLSDAGMAAPPSGRAEGLPVEDYLLHVVGHAIEEFTEAALLLTHAGHRPGGIEFLKYANRPAGVP